MKKKLLALAITVAALLIVVPAALALTYSQAFNNSWGENIYQCNNAGQGLYSCRHSNWNVPVCHFSGVDVPGRVEWNCDSSFIQNSNTPFLSGRICYRTVGWGPYGGKIDGSNTCYPIGGTG